MYLNSKKMTVIQIINLLRQLCNPVSGIFESQLSKV